MLYTDITIRFSIFLCVADRASQFNLSKIVFYNKFIIRLYMFRALWAHHQEVKLYYTARGIVTICRWPSGAQVERELVGMPVLSQPVHRTATYRV